MQGRNDTISRRAVLAGASGALVTLASGAHAQSFPSGPVKIVMQVGPGSSPDIAGRVLAEKLTKIWGHQVLVINQPGGAGAVAIKAVSAAVPDGHTLYLSVATNFIALPELQQNFPVDVLRDFVPIGYVGDHPMLIAVNNNLGVSTLAEFISLAKKRKGELVIAAGNRGSILHLTGEWLRAVTGIDVTLVHYQGAAQAVTDILGGRVHGMIDAVAAMRGTIEGGQIKPLAVATKQRLHNFPNIPTVAETIPGFEAVGWLALMAPPKTPAPIAKKISDDLRTALSDPELHKRFDELGTYIHLMTVDELTAFIRDQVQTWRPIIAETAKTLR